MKEILLAESAGFCFGVKRAVETVYAEAERAAVSGRERVYTYGPIIHNETVVRDLERRGVCALSGTEELKALPDHAGITVIIRSHGVGPEVYEICREKGIRVVDATCPFVSKIHGIAAEERRAGRRFVIIGDPGHPEVQAIMAWGGPGTRAVESAEEFVSLGIGKDEPVSIAAQTTDQGAKFKKIIDKIRIMGYDIRSFNTICNATHERQSEAAEIASKVDAMIVIGGRSSSNTRKLAEICSSVCPNTFSIQTAEDLDLNLLAPFRRIGITAGASTPKHIIEEVQISVRAKF